jgi:hypothetical protein
MRLPSYSHFMLKHPAQMRRIQKKDSFSTSSNLDQKNSALLPIQIHSRFLQAESEGNALFFLGIIYEGTQVVPLDIRVYTNP